MMCVSAFCNVANCRGDNKQFPNDHLNWPNIPFIFHFCLLQFQCVTQVAFQKLFGISEKGGLKGTWRNMWKLWFVLLQTDERTKQGIHKWWIKWWIYIIIRHIYTLFSSNIVTVLWRLLQRLMTKDTVKISLIL